MAIVPKCSFNQVGLSYRFISFIGVINYYCLCRGYCASNASAVSVWVNDGDLFENPNSNPGNRKSTDSWKHLDRDCHMCELQRDLFDVCQDRAYLHVLCSDANSECCNGQVRKFWCILFRHMIAINMINHWLTIRHNDTWTKMWSLSKSGVQSEIWF